MPSGAKKRKAAAKKKQQKGGGGLHIDSASSQSPSLGTDDRKLHLEFGSEGGLKSSHDGESDGDGGYATSPASQDHHQLRPFGGGQEDEEDNEEGGTPPLRTFVDDSNSSGDISAVDEVNEGGRHGDDEGGSSLTLASPDESVSKEESERADSTKEYDEEAPNFASESLSLEDSVKKEENSVQSEYADSLKESGDGQTLGGDQSINLCFETNEEQAHGFVLEHASLDHSVKRKESCNGNGEHADSVHVGELVDDEGFRIGIADNEVKKQEAYDFASEFVSLDDSVKMEKNPNSEHLDSVKEISGGTVGDDAGASIGNSENDLKKEEAHDFTSEPTFINDSIKKEVRDADSLYVQSVMKSHDGGTLGVTRNSNFEEKNEQAHDLASEPALLYDSVNFSDSVMRDVPQVIGSTLTVEACTLIGNPTSMADSIKLACSLPEDTNCSREAVSIDDRVVSGAVTLGLNANENLLSEVLPLLDEDVRVLSGASGMSFASKESEDKPLCPSDCSSVPNVETANVAENIKDSEETLECSERQPLVDSSPPPAKTSWKSCCGLFGVC